MELKEKDPGQDEEFPSRKHLVSLYGAGALSALLFSLFLDLDSMQTTVCLLIAWVLTTGALGISVLNDFPREEEAD